MKKTSLILASLLMGMIVLFNSCDKEITSTALVVDESQTATVKLYLKAVLDTTGKPVNVPNDIVVNASVLKSDLNNNFAGSERWTATANTASGVVEFTVPTIGDGLTAFIAPNDFEANYLTEMVLPGDTNSSPITIRKSYSMAEFATDDELTPGVIKVYTRTYMETTIDTIYPSN